MNSECVRKKWGDTVLNKFSHVNGKGEASMVDVGKKDVTLRRAAASARVIMSPATLTAVKENTLKKGDVLSAARIAGIQAAKRTWELIPLCHNIPIDVISVDFSFEGENCIIITAEARCEWKTGIEMEAMTAVSVAALTVYDMCKAADRSITITDIKLLRKDGGKSGEYVAQD